MSGGRGGTASERTGRQRKGDWGRGEGGNGGS